MLTDSCCKEETRRNVVVASAKERFSLLNIRSRNFANRASEHPFNDSLELLHMQGSDGMVKLSQHIKYLKNILRVMLWICALLLFLAHPVARSSSLLLVLHLPTSFSCRTFNRYLLMCCALNNPTYC